jgi:hypothetical protein
MRAMEPYERMGQYGSGVMGLISGMGNQYQSQVTCLIQLRCRQRWVQLLYWVVSLIQEDQQINHEKNFK